MPVLPRRLLAAAALVLGLAPLPHASGDVPSVLGSPSTYGLAKGFRLVGHTDLGKRGMNSPLAVAGSCAYVGDRAYDKAPRRNAGVAIVDVSRPSRPRQVGSIPAVPYSTQRELRADAALGLLVVESYDPYIGDGLTNAGVNALKTYDIRDCRHPRLLSTVDFGARVPHEFFLWKDPQHPGRALAYVTFTVFAPELEVVDLTDPTAPKTIGAYDLGADHADKTVDFLDESGSGYAHSISLSDDGTRAYLSGWDYGAYVLDTSAFASGSLPVGIAKPAGLGRLDIGHNIHSVVVSPKGVAVVGQEDYANAGHGCPFGWMRTADMSDPANPRVLGEFRLPENDPSTCGRTNGTFSSHNQTVFPDLALMTWYAGGLRAIDLRDPAHPREAGAFVPRPDFVPAERDDRLFFPTRASAPLLPTDTPHGSSTAPRRTGAMWSYPVVQNGYVYVVDIDLGLYVLRYTGPMHAEVDRAGFVEGNSSPAHYGRSTGSRRPAAQWAHVDAALAAHGPTTVRSPFRASTIRGRGGRGYGFLCQ